MATSQEATAELLAERGELTEAVEQLVELDEDGPWEYADVDCDSGTFGEIVSRDFVEPKGEGYRLVDREATRTALQEASSVEDSTAQAPGGSGDGTGHGTDDGTDGSRRDGAGSISIRERLRTGVTAGGGLVESRLAGIRRRHTGGRFPGSSGWFVIRSRSFTAAIVASLLFLFVMRAVLYREVFRGEHVVLPGNDPYHFRYWIDQLLVADVGLLDFSGMAEVIPTRNGLTYVLGWWATVIFGANPDSTGAVIAWLPVALTLIVGALVAWMALAVTEDERIAILSVVLLAVIPGHAQYTLVGFFDHHVVDYLWLAVMAAALVWLARDFERQERALDHLRRPRTWAVVGVFGTACAAAMLTWSGAPLLLIGVAIYAAVRACSDVRSDHSPLLASVPLVAGLALGTLIGYLMHARAGWQESAVIYAPGIVLVGVLAVALVAEGVTRVKPDPRIALGAIGVAGVTAVLVSRRLAASTWDRYERRFSEDLVGREVIAETRSLIAPDYLLSFGPLQQFGLLLLFAMPALVYVTWQCVRRHEPRWLVVASFAWAGVVLLCFQVRFSGEFSPFGAIFGAVGIIGILSRLEVVERLGCFGARTGRHLDLRASLHQPDRTIYVAFVVMVVVTVGLMYSVVLMGALTITHDEYEAAAYIAEEADGDEYVLSRWGRNRMYNYFAWGGGDSYSYADGTDTAFFSDSLPDDWYEEFATTGPHGTDRVGFVVAPDLGMDNPDPQSAYYQLFFEFGSATDVTGGVGHFRLVYRSSNGEQAVFRPVAGANLTGSEEPESVVFVETPVSADEDVEFDYVRRTITDEEGEFSVRVAHPGTYELPDGSTVEVTEEDVIEGNTI